MDAPKWFSDAVAKFSASGSSAITRLIRIAAYSAKCPIDAPMS